MRSIKTIEEYIESNKRGEKRVVIDFTNSKLKAFVLAEVQNRNVKSLIQHNNLTYYGDSCVYQADSILHFGKFKDCVLKDVFQCDPNYIKYCISNADLFVLHPNVIKLFNRKPTFNSIELEDHTLMKSDGSYLIDLTDLDHDSDGFAIPMNPTSFRIDPILENENNKKIEDSTMGDGIFKKNRNNVGSKSNQRVIKIKS